MAAMAKQISVISTFYCVANSITLQINTDKGVIYDINGDVVLSVKKVNLVSLHGRRVLYDNNAIPVVTIYEKIRTLHGLCKVFRGDSNDHSELLFSVKRSSMIQSGTFIRLNVFLADNKDKNMCDFRLIICGSETKSSCTVYAGESPTILAKMENNGGFKVSVCPNVDYAFIVTLLMIVHKIKDYFAKAGRGIKLATNTLLLVGTIALGQAITPLLLGENLAGGEQDLEEDDDDLEEEEDSEEEEDLDAVS